MSKQQLLSIVVPIYNEEKAVDLLFTELHRAMEGLGLEYEIICVDDGSQDGTRAKLTAKVSEDAHVRAVFLSRNFGKEAAMTAALDYSRGDAVIPIDADLQDPPELIPQMVAKWREGYDVVFAKRTSRQAETPLKRNTAGLFYKVFNALSEMPIPENVGDFRLMSRRAVDAVKQLPEKERFMKGLFCWPGLNSTTIEFEHKGRVKGESKFNYWRLWNLALNGITSFSSVPVRLGVYIGIVVSATAFISGVAIMLKTLVMGVEVPGYASLMVVVLFLGGVQLFFLGLLGEYIGRIYKEVKNRPIYMVDKALGFDEPT